MSATVHRHPTATFFLLAYVISWIAWAPSVAGAAGWTAERPEWWHYFGAVGPVSAAIIVTAVLGRRAVRDLLAQFDPRRVPPRWWVFVFASPVVLFAAGVAVARVVDGAWPTYEAVAKTGNLPALGLPLTFLVHLLTFGVGEETGWRGFALPRLEETRTPLRATAVLWAGWGLWHLPTFVTNDSFSGFAPVEIAGWAVGLYAGALLFTWLFHVTRRGLIAIVVWHALFNTLIASEAADGTIAAVMTTVLMIAVAVTVLRDRTLGRRDGSAASSRVPEEH